MSGRSSFGPELENSFLPSTGSTNLPLIAPVDLLNSMLLTLPASTAFTNSEYVRSAFDELLPARLLTMNAAAISASTIHGTQRSDGEPPPPEWAWAVAPGGRSGGGPSPLGGVPGGRESGRHDGGGVGGRPFGRWARGRARSRRLGFDPGFEIGLAAADPRAGSSSSIAPCYGPDAVRRSGNERSGLAGVNRRERSRIPRRHR